MVHTHLFWSTLIARFAVPKRVPLVSTIHSVYSIDAFQKNKIALTAERMSVRKEHNLIAVSNFVLTDYLEWVSFKGHAFVLYDFLPGSYFKENPRKEGEQQSLRCVAVGNLKEAKNYPYLLQIFSHLKNENITLDIYGLGGMREELNRTIEKENLPVQLRGHASTSMDLLKEYDLFIQASTHEGFGLSVIEAVAAHLPVFVSDIPVFREVTGRHAHFFPLANPAVAAEQLRSAKNELDLRYRYVDKAFHFAKDNFSEQRFIAGLRNIYDQILHRSNEHKDAAEQIKVINESA